MGGTIGGTEFAANIDRTGSGPARSAGVPASAGQAAVAQTEAVRMWAQRFRKRGRSDGMGRSGEFS